MKKRILPLILALCLCLGLSVPASAAAATVLTLNTPAELPDVGESFQVTVDISGNPGLAAMEMALYYNQDVVTCTDVQIGSILEDTMHVENPKKTSGPVCAFVTAITLKPTVKDGLLSTFTFQVKKTGEPGFALGEILLSTLG